MKEVVIEIDGVRHTLSEWSKISGISEDTIGARINYYGYSNKDAVFSPLRKIRNERHLDIANKRIKNETSQLSLF